MPPEGPRSKMKNVRLTALAEFDLIEAQDFYAPAGDWVLDHFISSISSALDDLAELAGIHPLRYGHHRMGVPHFPFSIYYDIEGEDAIVKAILDDRFGPARISAHFGPQYL